MGHGIDCKGRNAFHTQFFHDVFTVGNDGGEADIQKGGYLLVDMPFDNQCQHFDFAVGEYLARQYPRHGRKILAMGMGMLLQHKERAHKLVFGHINTKAMEPAGPGGRVATGCEHDGLHLPGKKELPMLQQNILGNKIMEKLFRPVIFKFFERPKSMHIHDGNDLLKYLFQT